LDVENQERLKGVKLVKLTLQVLGHCMYQALRHPRTRITQIANPQPIEVSQVPWWGCFLIMVFGAGLWVIAEKWDVIGLLQVAPGLIYMPLMHILDQSIIVARLVKQGAKRSGKSRR
jgi:hypothetical protein